MSNRDAKSYVNSMKTFKANNLFAEYDGQTYVVYSYGRHHPLYAYKDGTWYENDDRVSVTTSKHRNQSRPLAETKLVSTNEIKKIIN